MEMFRWILIIAGVAILALLYFSGRPKRPANQHQALESGRKPGDQDTSMSDDMYPQADNFDDITSASGEYAGQHSGLQPNTGTDQYAHSQPGQYSDQYADPQAGYQQADYQHNTQVSDDPLLADPNNVNAAFDDISDLDPDDFVRPGTGELPPELADSATSTKSSIAQKIESIGNRLSPLRGSRAGSSKEKPSNQSPEQSAGGETKIVTVHVVAPQDQVFNGATLYELFEQRGFHFGEMNIFHSMHQQQKMFSIAKMVEPGYFDINDINSFYTPGVTLILQLPGPVAADVAFEVLISEARGLAQHLGGVVLGSDRSTLSNQAVSHMREDIVNYMHEQRYFAKATS